MINKPLFASLTRISDLDRVSFEVRRLEKQHWESGDYVAGVVTSSANARTQVELPCGRMTEPMLGDHIVGAFGVRAATLEAAGHWNEIGADDHMHALTAAGLIGKATSVSTFIPAPLTLTYCGHCVRGGSKVTMSDFVRVPPRVGNYDRPTILFIGTSMSSGKTTSAKIIIRHLARSGLKVAAAKFTGAGRQRDVLAMRDAGAETIMSFVDVGLPSTICPAEEYQSALDKMLALLEAAEPDVVVAEAGASPLEPYNGDTFVKSIQQYLSCTVLCASDPYAVVGVTQGFGFRPDLVAGVATSTTAGVVVSEKLTGIQALNLLDPGSHPALKRLLAEKISRFDPSVAEAPSG